MTIEFRCPGCKKKLKTADDRAGLRVNCPGCGEPLTVPSPAFTSEGTEPPGVEAAGAGGAATAVATPGGAAEPTGDVRDTRPCPMCGAEIKRTAVRCRFCGENVAAPQRDAGTGEIEAGDILSRSWAIYQKNLGLLVGSTLVMMGIAGGAFITAYMGVGLVTVLVTGPDGGGPEPGASAIAIVVAAAAVFLLMFVAATSYLWGGYHKLLLKVARGERADFSDLFSGGRYVGRLFVGYLLFGALACVGLALFFFPYFFVILIFWPFSYVIVDKDAGVIEAFRKSFELASRNLLAIFVLFMAVIGINMLGELACMVGLIFSTPLASLNFAVAYCRMNRQLTAAMCSN